MRWIAWAFLQEPMSGSSRSEGRSPIWPAARPSGWNISPKPFNFAAWTGTDGRGDPLPVLFHLRDRMIDGTGRQRHIGEGRILCRSGCHAGPIRDKYIRAGMKLI